MTMPALLSAASGESSMSDEFDDANELRLARPARQRPVLTGPQSDGQAELIAHVYDEATEPLRMRLLELLLGPVGPLGLVAVAPQAFGRFLERAWHEQIAVSLDDVAHVSVENILGLASYVEQCSPETFRQIASLLTESPTQWRAWAAPYSH